MACDCRCHQYAVDSDVMLHLLVRPYVTLGTCLMCFVLVGRCNQPGYQVIFSTIPQCPNGLVDFLSVAQSLVQLSGLCKEWLYLSQCSH